MRRPASCAAGVKKNNWARPVNAANPHSARQLAQLTTYYKQTHIVHTNRDAGGETTRRHVLAIHRDANTQPLVIQPAPGPID